MAAKKIIAICQSGGEFKIEKDGCLSYKGGDAHAIDIDDQMKFNEFKAKVAEMFSLTVDSMSIKYLLPVNKKTLITISNDKDLQRMVKFHGDSCTVDIYILIEEIVSPEVSNRPASRSSRTTLSETVVPANTPQKYTQASLVTEVSKQVADDFVCEATTLDIPDHVKQESNSPKSTPCLSGSLEVRGFDLAMNASLLNSTSHSTVSADHHCHDIPVQNDGLSEAAESNEAKALASEVIELINDDRNEEPSTVKQIPVEQLESMRWHYRDPQGDVQGPFSITWLKRWRDANYFSPDFKIWKEGQSQDESVLLVDILHQFFPN